MGTDPMAAPPGGAGDNAGAAAVADAIAAAVRAALAEPGMADALASAQVVTLTFAEDGAIEVDVDGTAATVAAGALADDPDADDASMPPPAA